MSNYYEFQNASKILSGNFAIENIPHEFKALGAKRILILTDETLKKIGTLQTVIDGIDTKEIEIAGVFSKIPQDSSIEIIKEIVKQYKELNCEAILAVGGGSVIDTAKGVRMVLSQEKEDIMQLMGCEIIYYGKHIPFIAIPTTSGTGSEATLVAVILNSMQNVKMEFISYFLVPDAAVLDPRMTLTLPKKITASTGMDTLCHAIESYTCIQKNPMSDAYAVAAIEIIRENLVLAVKNGKDKKVRNAMANASLMAGVAFSNSMVGLIHAIGHSVGAVSRVPHGDAMSILMPHCMRFNKDKLEKEYAKLLLYIGGEEVYIQTPKEQRANKTIMCIEEILNELNSLSGLPTKLSEAGVKREDFESIAKKSLNDGAMIVNPKQASYDDVMEILKQAF
ncbi:MAG: iron-containing alcohol dehydrogenase [Clostridia bacterium]|nr:iron-containing alcohol dehydrogenase [Clostridia bacterium]